MRKVLGPNIACQTQLSELQFKVLWTLLGQKHLTKWQRMEVLGEVTGLQESRFRFRKPALSPCREGWRYS